MPERVPRASAGARPGGSPEIAGGANVCPQHEEVNRGEGQEHPGRRPARGLAVPNSGIQSQREGGGGEEQGSHVRKGSEFQHPRLSCQLRAHWLVAARGSRPGADQDRGDDGRAQCEQRGGRTEGGVLKNEGEAGGCHRERAGAGRLAAVSTPDSGEQAVRGLWCFNRLGCPVGLGSQRVHQGVLAERTACSS